MRRPYVSLLLFILGAFAAGTIGSLATFSSVGSWYPTLQKPSWTPPSAVFGPVWTTLYVLMGIAAWRAWRRAGEASGAVLRPYVAQLVLNALWSVLFFGLRNPTLALVDVIALWILLALIQVRFWRIDRLAAALWLPYLIWVSYATALNAAIVRLN